MNAKGRDFWRECVCLRSSPARSLRSRPGSAGRTHSRRLAPPLHFQQISNNFTPRSVVDYAPSHPATEQPAPAPPPKKVSKSCNDLVAKCVYRW